MGMGTKKDDAEHADDADDDHYGDDEDDYDDIDGHDNMRARMIMINENS